MTEYTEREIIILKTLEIEYALQETARQKPTTIEQAVERTQEVYEFLAKDI